MRRTNLCTKPAETLDALAGKLEAERVSMAQQIAAKEEKLQNELKEL